MAICKGDNDCFLKWYFIVYINIPKHTRVPLSMLTFILLIYVWLNTETGFQNTCEYSLTYVQINSLWRSDLGILLYNIC